VRFGLNLINFGTAANPSVFRRWASFAEDAGYHSLMISDHVAFTPDVAAEYPAPFYDPFTTLSWLAGFTKHIKLGTTVVVLPYRHPLLVARMGANVDQLSGGRFVFGIGSGWARQEFEALGVPFANRGPMTDEYLRVIKAAWRSETISFDGRFVSFVDVQTGPRPIQVPHPPIWVGGESERSIRRAVELGDAWHPIWITAQWLKKIGVPLLRKHSELAARAEPALCPRIRLSREPADVADEVRLAGIGSADQIRQDLNTFAELGVDEVLLDTHVPGTEAEDRHDLNLLEEFAADIVDLEAGTVR
jgi:probable F420-dependent oxidoreductase